MANHKTTMTSLSAACRVWSLVSSKIVKACSHISKVVHLGYTASLSVLVSARTELIFFLVAGIVLCFGFSRKIMLITH